MLNEMLVGAIALAGLLVGLFFLRFWRTTGDRFFLYFALSFGIEGLNRTFSALTNSLSESSPTYYLIRLLSYGFILLAIWEKNKPRRRPQ